MSQNYEPGTYVKGDQARVCQTKADAVQAVFDGFKLSEDAPAVETDEVDETDSNTSATPDPDSAQETSANDVVETPSGLSSLSF